MRALKIKVGITLDGNIVERVKALAEDCDRSFSQYINVILKEHIKEREKINPHLPENPGGIR